MQTDEVIDVTICDGCPGRFDLIVAADGLHLDRRAKVRQAIGATRLDIIEGEI